MSRRELQEGTLGDKPAAEGAAGWETPEAESSLVLSGMRGRLARLVEHREWVVRPAEHRQSLLPRRDASSVLSVQRGVRESWGQAGT